MGVKVCPSGEIFLCQGIGGVRDKNERINFFRSDKRISFCSTCLYLDRCSKESSEAGEVVKIEREKIKPKSFLYEKRKKPVEIWGDEENTECFASEKPVGKKKCVTISSHPELNEKFCFGNHCDSPYCVCLKCVSQAPGEKDFFLEHGDIWEMCRVSNGGPYCGLHNQNPEAIKIWFEEPELVAILTEPDSTEIIDDLGPDSLIMGLGGLDEEEKQKMDKEWKEMTKEERLNAMKDRAARGKTVAETAKELGISDQTPRNYAKKHGLTFASGKIEADSGDKRKRGMKKGEKVEKAKRIRELLKSGKHPDDIASELKVHISTVYNHKKKMLADGELTETGKAAAKKKGDKKKKVKKTRIKKAVEKKIIKDPEREKKLDKILAKYTTSETKEGRCIQIFSKDDDDVSQQVAIVFMNGNKKTVIETGKEIITVENLATNAD